ncbi:MAG: ABC transporter ATP-binding protein [Pseudomonadales bacterium]
MSLAFTDIDHSFGDQPVLRGVSLAANAGEILCLLGASGSGKTTLLRLAAGLEQLQSGRITLGTTTLADRTVHVPPEQRGIGLVFQDHVLYPHLTVAENVAFGLRDQSASRRQEIVATQLQAVSLDGFGDRYPHTLSGGQQQRVALARALAPQPGVMLLDEPFASVDSALRRRLREQARLALKASAAITVVVTHDAEEAMQLGDRIAYLVAGEVAQCDTPNRFWQAPANATVALAFGDAQSLDVKVAGDIVHTAFGDLPTAAVTDQRQRLDVPDGLLVLRPRALAVTPSSERPGAEVVDRRFAGDGIALLLRSVSAPQQALLRAVVADDARADRLQPGSGVRIDCAPAQSFLFDAP